jgi:hypothetical protein
VLADLEHLVNDVSTRKADSAVAIRLAEHLGCLTLPNEGPASSPNTQTPMYPQVKCTTRRQRTLSSSHQKRRHTSCGVVFGANETVSPDVVFLNCVIYMIKGWSEKQTVLPSYPVQRRLDDSGDKLYQETVC